MSNIDIRIENIDSLKHYEDIPSVYYAEKKLEMTLLNGGLEGLKLGIVPIENPYWVDFDAFEDSGADSWMDKWDLKNWCIIAAYIEGIRVDGAVVAHDTKGVNRLEGKSDITALWDIRVHPDHKGKGVGWALINKAIEVSKEKKCKYMKIESQNTNVVACNFYRKNGGVLGAYKIEAYDDEPGVIMLDWYVYL